MSFSDLVSDSYPDFEILSRILSISACFCQQVLEVDSVMKASEEQFKACAAKYVCEGNAKASCLLQADRQWDTCEFL